MNFFPNLYFLLFLYLVSSETFLYTDIKLQMLMDEAKHLNPLLENLLKSISNDFNDFKKVVQPIMGPLKTRERTFSKMFDEKGLNLLEIHDFSRGTLIFLDLNDMYSALDKFKQIPFINITKKISKSDVGKILLRIAPTFAPTNIDGEKIIATS